ncbi:DUF6434 domain-containing protein [Pseudomonas sp. SED1]|nr:DUF6434 domain-containing protein [Pseudomonas sp. SED1]MDY0833771.1 DUF6434 domain-containing protein [Pseudomonas sp. SED1]
MAHGYAVARDLIAWIRNDIPRTMGDGVDQWQRRNSQ